MKTQNFKSNYTGTHSANSEGFPPEGDKVTLEETQCCRGKSTRNADCSSLSNKLYLVKWNHCSHRIWLRTTTVNRRRPVKLHRCFIIRIHRPYSSDSVHYRKRLINFVNLLSRPSCWPLCRALPNESPLCNSLCKVRKVSGCFVLARCV